MSFHNAKKVTIDDIVFDSKLEGDYYKYLKVLQKNGEITSFKLQPVYVLQGKLKECGLREITYVADFEVLFPNGNIEVIDVKGLATETSKLKRKLFLFVHRDKTLKWICRYKSERVDYFDNRKRISKNKKL